MSDEPAGDVEVLGPDEPPRSPTTSGSTWRKAIVAIAVVMIATIAWLNRPGDEPPGVISDDPFDPGARTQPLYPGAVGRLLFTVQEEPAAGLLAGETLWSVRLDTSLAERGPLIPPVGTTTGVPAAPGLPPNRGFLLGPRGTAAAGTLAFLADAPPDLGGRRFVYGLDVGSRLPIPPTPVAEGVAFAFGARGEMIVLRPEENGDWIVDVVGRARVARLGPFRESVLTLAISGGGTFILQSTSPFAGKPIERILRIDGDASQTVLGGHRVVGVGLNAQFLTNRLGSNSPLLLFQPGRRPQPLPGFAPLQIVGWTGDRQHYAAVGEFRGDFGLWFVAWPNTPVFRMMTIDADAGESIDVVAFDEQARVAFFVHELDIWAVEIGSERAFRLPLPDDAARELPSGPLVWVP